MRRLLTIAALAVLTLSPVLVAQDRWFEADRRTRRLAPGSFPTMPAEVQMDLRARGCTIPQHGTVLTPHNAVRGHFRTPDAFDWAVLCSIRGVSTIIVYWGGRPDDYSLLARAYDVDWLEMIGPAAIAYGRRVRVADAASLKRTATEAGLSSEAITHDGITDGFDSSSSVYYLLNDRWIRLPAATDRGRR
jgi:hypothetical protein